MRLQRITVFQFYLSSIKRVKNRIFHAPGKKFQFYLSSIKSYDTVGKYTNNISFNSTLVQLKAVVY